MASSLSHNKQLERTVMRHRRDAASAPFHYALASRFTRRRAAAQLQRYAYPNALSRLLRHWIRYSFRTMFVCALSTWISADLAAQSNLVNVYVTHVEVDGMRFESLGALSEYLLSAQNDVFGMSIRECTALSREREVMRVLGEVLGKRFAARGDPIFAFNMITQRVPCEEPKQ
jgi:hypothetical protein